LSDGKACRPRVIDTLDRDRFIPVIAPIGFGEDGQTYNTTADIAAGKIAEALRAEKLILLTDVEGVKEDGGLISTLTESQVRDLMK
jgi:acetylglutamate kinase